MILRALIALLLVASTAAAELKAGFAKTDITPAKPVPLAGYGARQGKPSTGVHDTVWARAAVFEADGRKSAILSVDMVGVTGEVRALLVKGICAELKIASEDLLFCATHNHSGPGGLSKNVLVRLAAGKYDQELFDWVLKRLEQALREADAALAPARIASGPANFAGLSRNRAVDDGPVDPDGIVVKVTDPAGKLRALFVNFAAHPTVIGSESFEISGDWPGAMCRFVEATHSGVMPFFLNGAEGDQSPHAPPGENRWERMERMGEAVAKVALAAAEKLEAKDGAAAGMLREVRLPPAAMTGEGFPTSSWIQVFDLGGARFFCLPGEPCVAIGFAVKGLAPGALAGVVACANDHLGYFVPRAYYYTGGYESTLNFFGPGIEEWFVARFTELLKGVPEAALEMPDTTVQTRGRLKIVHGEGFPRDIGRAHGRSLVTEIRAHCAFWRQQLTAMGGALPVRQFLPFPEDVDPAPLLFPLVAIRCRMLLRDCEPALLEEMEGIAEGAGVPFDEIVFLNTWLAVADQTDPTALFRMKPGCATLVTPRYLAHNSDWPATRGFPDVAALLVVRPKDGRALALMTFAGCVGAPTLTNSAGVSASVDSLPAPQDTSLEGLPVWLAVRSALQYNALAVDAAEAIELTPGTAGYMITLADPKEFLRLEVSATHSTRDPEKPREAPKADRKKRSIVKAFASETRDAKRSQIRELFGEREKGVLAPHTRHSVIVSRVKQTWWVAIGPGKEITKDSYQEVDLEPLFAK